MNKPKTITLLVLVLALSGTVFSAEADSAPSKEYQVKAAFIYNFIKFVDWPEPAAAEADKKTDESAKPITIGIIGENPFGNAFEAITKKDVEGKKVVVKYFPEFTKNSTKYKNNGQTKYKYKDGDALKACQVLFVCSSESEYRKEIIDTVQNNCVLTIGETKDFLEAGGIIEFVTEEKKVKFSINLIAAENAKLKIRSKLLRLAKKVVQKEEDNT
jgi:hypothetical protein